MSEDSDDSVTMTHLSFQCRALHPPCDAVDDDEALAEFYEEYGRPGCKAATSLRKLDGSYQVLDTQGCPVFLTGDAHGCQCVAGAVVVAYRQRCPLVNHYHAPCGQLTRDKASLQAMHAIYAAEKGSWLPLCVGAMVVGTVTHSTVLKCAVAEQRKALELQREQQEKGVGDRICDYVQCQVCNASYKRDTAHTCRSRSQALVGPSWSIGRVAPEDVTAGLYAVQKHPQSAAEIYLVRGRAVPNAGERKLSCNKCEPNVCASSAIADCRHTTTVHQRHGTDKMQKAVPVASQDLLNHISGQLVRQSVATRHHAAQDMKEKVCSFG